MILQIQLPGFLSLTIKNIAGGNTFLAMMLVGTILAEVPLRSLPERDTIYYSFIRLVFIPFLVFAACRLAHVDSLVTGVSVVLSGMPAASVTAVLAAKYDKDEIFATKCVVLSTLLSHDYSTALVPGSGMTGQLPYTLLYMFEHRKP